MATVTSQFRRAVSLHRSGRLQQAEGLYQEILDREPQHSGALHQLGLLASQAGQPEAAAIFITRAIQVRGPDPDLCVHLGLALAQQGKTAQSAACYRQAIERNPSNPEAHFLLGNTLWLLQQSPDAETCYREAVRLHPRYAEAFHNLGVVCMAADRVDDAAAAFRQAIILRPEYAEAHQNLGILSQARRHLDEAEKHYRRALAIAPNRTGARYNLGLLLQELDRPEEACAAYQTVLGAEPDHDEARNNLGNVHLALNHPGDAARCYHQVLARLPDHVQAHWNLGLAHLLAGDLQNGWTEYEWRFRQPGAYLRRFPQPLWDGGPLHNRRILLWSEQGMGDTIQFARYAAMVAGRGGQVILECHEPLVRLLEGVRGVQELVGRDAPVPPFDCHAPLMSLPGICGTTRETIPAGVPYLRADPRLEAHWRERVLRHPAPLRVGLTWSGNPLHRNDRHRSLRPSDLPALAGLDHVAFFQIQKNAAPVEVPGLHLIDLDEDGVNDFADTAAILRNLDLLVSVDTSVAHLGGALGIPVWTLLPFAPDWRWMLGRNDSPWYPSMRLWRQSRRNDWTGVLAQVREEISRLLQGL